MITALWLLACASEPTAPPVELPPVSAGDRGLAIVYSHDLDGEIEPCG